MKKLATNDNPQILTKNTYIPYGTIIEVIEDFEIKIPIIAPANAFQVSASIDGWFFTLSVNILEKLPNDPSASSRISNRDTKIYGVCYEDMTSNDFSHAFKELHWMYPNIQSRTSTKRVKIHGKNAYHYVNVPLFDRDLDPEFFDNADKVCQLGYISRVDTIALDNSLDTSMSIASRQPDCFSHLFKKNGQYRKNSITGHVVSHTDFRTNTKNVTRYKVGEDPHLRAVVPAGTLMLTASSHFPEPRSNYIDPVATVWIQVIQSHCPRLWHEHPDNAKEHTSRRMFRRINTLMDYLEGMEVRFRAGNIRYKKDINALKLTPTVDHQIRI